MADNNDLRVIVSLDIPKSVPVIEKDLRKLENILANNSKNGKLSLVGRLDPEKTKNIIEKQLSSLKIDGSKLKITPQLDISGANNGSNVFQNIQNSANIAKKTIQDLRNDLLDIDKTKADFRFKAGVNDNGEDLKKTLENARELFSAYKDIDDIQFKWSADESGEVNKISAIIKSVTGQVETLRFELQQTNGVYNDVFAFVGSSSGDTGIAKATKEAEKLAIKTEETRTKYTRLLEEFKSSNSAIQTGLTQPIAKFEEVLNGLGTTHSIEDVKNQFESLKTSAAEISKYLDTTNNSFNKTRNAINNYNQMDDAIKRIETSYNNLVIKNEELGKSVINLRSSYSALVEKEKEQGGYTAEWAKDYQAVNAALREVRVNVEAAVRAESNSQNADRNSQYQIQQRYLDRIRQNYIELNKLQNALVSSGKNETAEIQRQIKQVRSRISYATEQLKKRELFANVEAQINDYENEFDRKQSLRNSKETDKLIANYTKMADEISRATQELTKLQNSSTIRDNGSNAVVQNLKVQIDSVITDFNNLYERLSNSTVDKKTFVELQNQLSNIANKAKEVKNSFVDISNAISSDNKAQKQLEKDQAQVASLERQIKSLILQIKTLQATKRMTTGQSDSLTGLLSDVNASKDKSTLDDLKVKFAELRNEINLTDKQLKGEDKISDKYAKMASNIEVAIRKLYELKDTPVFNDRANATASAGIDAEINKITADYIALLDLLKNSPKDSNTLKSFETELKNISARASEVKAAINQIANNTTASEKLDSNFKSLATDIDNAISKLNSFDRSAIFRNHNTDSGVVQFKQELASLIEKYNQLKTALGSTPKTSEAFQQLQQQANALGVKLKQAKIRNDELQAGLRNADGATQLTARVQKLTAQIKEYMAVNTKAAKKYSGQFDGLLSGLSQAEINKDSEAVRRLSADFQILRSQIKAAGDQGKTLWQSFIDGAKRFTMWFSITANIARAIRSIRQMISTVRELNTAMTAVIRVTQGTDAAYKQFFENAIASAKELKMNLVDLISQSAEWAKRGYNLSEVPTLAKASGIYSVVADIDNATAVQHLTTVLKTYNLTADDAIEVTSKLDNIANRYAVTAGDLGEILAHSISAMQVSHNTLDQTIAMGTAIAQITGNANEAGSTLKVLSMRLRGASTELINAGEDTEGMAESTSKLREKIMALTNVNGKGGFDIMVDADNFKSTYEIMEGISKVWKDISDVNQANIICLYVQKCA